MTEQRCWRRREADWRQNRDLDGQRGRSTVSDEGRDGHSDGWWSWARGLFISLVMWLSWPCHPNKIELRLGLLRPRHSNMNRLTQRVLSWVTAGVVYTFALNKLNYVGKSHKKHSTQAKHTPSIWWLSLILFEVNIVALIYLYYWITVTYVQFCEQLSVYTNRCKRFFVPFLILQLASKLLEGGLEN